MADKKDPMKGVPRIFRYSTPSMKRGAGEVLLAPFVHGIKARLGLQAGPTKKELEQWQAQVESMQRAGYQWSADNKQWVRPEDGDIKGPWEPPKFLTSKSQQKMK